MRQLAWLHCSLSRRSWLLHLGNHQVGPDRGRWRRTAHHTSPAERGPQYRCPRRRPPMGGHPLKAVARSFDNHRPGPPLCHGDGVLPDRRAVRHPVQRRGELPLGPDPLYSLREYHRRICPRRPGQHQQHRRVAPDRCLLTSSSEDYKAAYAAEALDAARGEKHNLAWVLEVDNPDGYEASPGSPGSGILMAVAQQRTTIRRCARSRWQRFQARLHADAHRSYWHSRVATFAATVTLPHDPRGGVSHITADVLLVRDGRQRGLSTPIGLNRPGS